MQRMLAASERLQRREGQLEVALILARHRGLPACRALHQAPSLQALGQLVARAGKAGRPPGQGQGKVDRDALRGPIIPPPGRQVAKQQLPAGIVARRLGGYRAREPITPSSGLLAVA